MSARRVTKAGRGADDETRGILLLSLFALGMMATMWTWGAAAAALAGNAPPASFWEALVVLPRLIAHLDDPARAWGARSEALPGAGAIWGVLGALVIVGVAGVVVLSRVGRERGWTAPEMLRRRSRFAEWATLRDLRSLIVQAGRHPDRIALGTFGGSLLAASHEASVLIVGAARSGKTSGALIPALLEHRGPAIATSVKEDLLQTLPFRRSIGEVRIFDPTGSVAEVTSGWSPVHAARDFRAARRVAHRLLNQGGVEAQNAEFWIKSGVRLLGPVLLAAHEVLMAVEQGATGEDLQAVDEDASGMELVLLWLEGQEKDEVVEALDAHENAADARRAISQLQAVWALEPRTLSSVYATIAAALEPYQDREVLMAELTRPITPEWLLAGNNTVFVVAPAHEQTRLRGLFVAMLTDLIDSAYVQAAKEPGGRLSPTLLLALDEVANIASLPDLDQIASTGGGVGIKLLTGVQNVAQLQERWGREKTETILANHVARVFVGGVADEAGLAYLRTVAGEEEIDTVSRSNGGDHGSHRSYATTFRPLIDGPVAREMAAFEAMLIYGRLPTARIRLRPWFKDKRLSDLISHPSGAAADGEQSARARA